MSRNRTQDICDSVAPYTVRRRRWIRVLDQHETLQAQYSYGPYGERTKIAGSGPDADFGFAGMYHRVRSDLNLTLFRAYDSRLGRWLSRDPLGESLGANLYAYVGNEPVGRFDPLGLIMQGDYWNVGEFAADALVVGNGGAAVTGLFGMASSVTADWTNLPGPQGGQRDAFRHCIWSCVLTKVFGAEKAQQLTDNHETLNQMQTSVQNWLPWRAHQTSASSEADKAMDTANNAAGREVGNCGKPCFDECRAKAARGGLSILH